MIDDELQHHGVKGMKWGVRRYQNKDGSLTSAGKKREVKKAEKYTKSLNKSLNNVRKYSNRQKTNEALFEYASKSSSYSYLAADYKRRAEKNSKKVDSYIAKHDKLVDDIYDSGYEVRQKISSGEYYVSKKLA